MRPAKATPLRRWALLLAATSVLLAFTAHVMGRLSQNQSGLCVAAHQVLGEEEMARRVAMNLLLNEVRNSNRHEAVFRNGRLRVGLIRASGRPDVQALVEESFGNDKSFEENFSIEPVAPADGDLDLHALGPAFTVVTYDALSGGGATFIWTADIRRAPGFALAGGGQEISLLERYRGFGNHYYRVARTFIARDCCDNRRYSHSLEKHLSRRRQAYQASMGSFKRGLANHEHVVAISNCGDILAAESNVGAGLLEIRWLSL